MADPRFGGEELAAEKGLTHWGGVTFSLIHILVESIAQAKGLNQDFCAME